MAPRSLFLFLIHTFPFALSHLSLCSLILGPPKLGRKKIKCGALSLCTHVFAHMNKGPAEKHAFYKTWKSVKPINPTLGLLFQIQIDLNLLISKTYKVEEKTNEPHTCMLIGGSHPAVQHSWLSWTSNLFALLDLGLPHHLSTLSPRKCMMWESEWGCCAEGAFSLSTNSRSFDRCPPSQQVNHDLISQKNKLTWSHLKGKMTKHYCTQHMHVTS
jgi:hypothetical protein